MKRRRAFAVIAASLMLFASQAGGQEPIHRVGVLANIENPEPIQAFLGGLRERGHVVGRNLQIEYRYWQAQTERIPALVAELAAFDPEVIIASTPQSALAVRVAAPTVPLVFISVADPVALGLVESLARPGGNVTGFATVVPEDFLGKSLQLLKELVPRATRIAILINPTNPIHQREQPQLPETERLLGVELVLVEASQPDQYEIAFERAQKQGADAIHVVGDALIVTQSAKIVGLAARYRLPAMYFGRRHVADGGLMSYSPNTVDFWCRALAYVDKILKGERAGDLPVQQPTRFDLFGNHKTAAALGITVPPSILALADEVIE